MKYITLILLCCLLMSACAPQQPAPTDAPSVPSFTDAPAPAPTEAPTVPPFADAPAPIPTEVPAPVKFTIYTPNENADGFYDTVIVIDALTAQNVVDELIKEHALNEDIRVNSEQLEDSQLLLDFNAAFREQLVTYGTAGEKMMIGSVVNTFLSAYGADSLMITIDGEILESGHVIYDFPLEFIQ